MTQHPYPEGMVAARAWRSKTAAEKEAASACRRCGGTRLIRTWGGRAGEGGRVGPCPECSRLATYKFVKALAEELFFKWPSAPRYLVEERDYDRRD